MSRHKTCYVISYHGILCHDMSYVTTIAASLIAKLYIYTHMHTILIIMICSLYTQQYNINRDSMGPAQ